MMSDIKKVFVNNKGRVFSISDMTDRQYQKWIKQVEQRFRIARDNLIDITVHRTDTEWENLTPINKRRFIVSEVNIQIFDWLGVAASEEMDHMKTIIRQQTIEIGSLKTVNKVESHLESDRLKQILLFALNKLEEGDNIELVKAILTQARDDE
tara:strand:+ start:2046 stop:2504 length:459 start_codon:yes stop_codon:yes gene_type:complete